MLRAAQLRLVPATLAVAGVLMAGIAGAVEIRVMTSGGFTAAASELTPAFERATGHKVLTVYGASMGSAPDAIPSRLARGEPTDIVILASGALDALIRDGKVVAGSRVDLVRSTIGMAVRAGSPKPDIGTVEALKRTLLEAGSIAYSASASGVYLSTELFVRLGVAEQVNPKARRIMSERVGTVVARGEAEIGFQQVSELLPVKGIDYVGPLPPEVQQVTVFSAGIAVGAREPEAARALIRFFTARESAPVISRTGLEPVTAP
jgi:molybdate transport system substrate-binding protein